MAKYDKMTRKQLYEMARAQGHKGISRLKKAELLQLLQEAEKLAAPAAAPEVPPGERFIPAPVSSMERPVEDRAVEVESEGPEAEVHPSGKRESQDVYVDWGYPLPEHYGLDRMAAAAKDPNWIFVHWDLSGNRREEVARSHGPGIFAVSRWYLRVVDLASEEKADYPINVDSRSWYLPVSEDGTFRVHIGLITPEGSFIEFASTREVKTPRARPSENVAEEWMVADEEFQRFLRQAGDLGASEMSSSDLAAQIRKNLARE